MSSIPKARYGVYGANGVRPCLTPPGTIRADKPMQWLLPGDRTWDLYALRYAST
jgi:hypothetical protein